MKKSKFFHKILKDYKETVNANEAELDKYANNKHEFDKRYKEKQERVRRSLNHHNLDTKL